jgi:hypothetical protein
MVAKWLAKWNVGNRATAILSWFELDHQHFVEPHLV